MCAAEFVDDTATRVIYPLSLHDALPIWDPRGRPHLARVEKGHPGLGGLGRDELDVQSPVDRKSTRLNSSHITISYAVFCLKKKSASRPEDWRRNRHLTHDLREARHHTCL